LFAGCLTAAVLVLCLTTASLAGTAGVAHFTIEKTAIGKVVANASGHTLYLFRADSGTKSACYGQCAKYWPPLLTTGKPVAAPGMNAALLGTAKRKDGTTQVTYKGHPLYTFLLDKAAGQTKGEGSKNFGASWYALAPNGATIDKD
jgi:predicted lipoprotein with Yx(FWY)xxD motif